MKLLSKHHKLFTKLNLDKYEIADPFLYKYKNNFYLLGTTDQKSIKIFKNNDLHKDWLEKNNNEIYKQQNNNYSLISFVFGNFGSNLVWAPEIVKIKNYFYIYFTENHQIYVIRSKNIYDKYSKPKLINLPDKMVIDPHIFKDNNKIYLFYASFNKLKYLDGPMSIKVIEMKTPFKCKNTSSTEIIHPNNNWEKYNSSLFSPKGINEGPFVLKLGKYYVLFYSGSGADTEYYNIGIAVSLNVMGPYMKLTNESGILDLNKYKGGGHCSIIKHNNNYYLVAHINTNQKWKRYPVYFKLNIKLLKKIINYNYSNGKS